MTDATPTVHQAIAAVTGKLKGIGKNRRNKEQGYNFRGIDDVLTALHPLLAEHGLVFVPNVVDREYEERVSSKGTVGHCAHLHVVYRIYGPAGDHVEGSTWGEGLDYGDKATNKAMTAAFKYLLFQVFAICDPDEDADATTPEQGSRPRNTRPSSVVGADPETGEVRSGPKMASDKQLGMLRALGRERGYDTAAMKDAIGRVVGRDVEHLRDLTSREASAVIDAFKKAEQEEQEEYAPDEDRPYAPDEEPF